MDDVGWSDLGFMGGGIAFGQPTPMMDRYASQGLVLTSAYSTPSCTPSRASLLTGQDPLHHGLLRPAAPGEPGGLSDPMTLPMVLQKLGYATHGVGKWHLGENKSGLPQNLGFDDFYGFFGVPEYFAGWRDVYFNPQVALSPDRFKYFDEREASRYEETCRSSNHDSCEKGPVIDLSYVKELDDRYATYTEKLIRDGGNGKQPWFIMENTRGCHFFKLSERQVGRAIAGAQRLQRLHCRNGQCFRALDEDARGHSSG